MGSASRGAATGANPIHIMQTFKAVDAMCGTMQRDERSGRKLKTIERAIEIIEALEESGGGGVTEIAERLELSPATVHGYLKTLEHNRLLVKEGDVYRLGLRFLSVGGYVRSQKPVYDVTKQKLKQLAQDTGERAQLVIEEHGIGIVVDKEVGQHAVQVDNRVGKSVYLHSTSAGKAILSQFTERQLGEVLDRWGLPAQTSNTITDRDALVEDLELTRERGYAYNNEEHIMGLKSIGVPISGPGGTVIGAVSISGPSHRLMGKWYDEEIPSLLLGAANEIELNIEYNGSNESA